MDRNLRYYRFMGSPVKSQKGALMKHDYKYWQECGFYEGFEANIQQTIAEAPLDSGLREGWEKKGCRRKKFRPSFCCAGC